MKQSCWVLLKRRTPKIDADHIYRFIAKNGLSVELNIWLFKLKMETYEWKSEKSQFLYSSIRSYP